MFGWILHSIDYQDCGGKDYLRNSAKRVSTLSDRDTGLWIDGGRKIAKTGISNKPI